MAVLATAVAVVFRPKWGPDFIIRFHVAPGIVDPTNAGVQAIVSAINSVTRAVAIEIELTQISSIEGSAVLGADYVSADKAQFNAIDEDGKAHNYKVPGLVEDILEDDQETILLDTAGVDDVVTALTTYARGRGGADVTGVGSAHRTANRKRLKSAPAV